jgi:diguanylate cyclase (GGDEF)-like protein
MEPKARAGVPAWLGYLAVGVAVAGCYYLVPAHGAGRLSRVVLYCLVSLSAAAAVWVGLRRNRPMPRLPWLLLGLGQLVYAIADTDFYASRYLYGSTGFPSVADLLYLCHYPLMMVGLSLLIRSRIPRRDLPGLLDVGVLVVVAALPYWLYLIEPHSHFAVPLVEKAVCVGYPVMDLALLAVALRLMLGAGRRPAAFLLLCGSLLAALAADTVYVLQQLHGDYAPGRVLDLVWLLGDLCLGAAALHPTMGRLARSSHARDASRVPVRVVALSATAFTAPVMLLVEYAGHAYRDIPATAVACALLFGLSIARVAGLVADQRRSAITDALTGLHTRRFVEAQLALEAARARRAGTTVAMFVLDVDDFKSINERYGHPAGDRVLIEIADRLREVIRPGDVVGRYGGEEFAVLAPGIGPDELDAMSRRLSHQVAGSPITVLSTTYIMITVSVGAVSYPSQGDDPEELVAAVDRALTRAKSGGWDREPVGISAHPAPGATLVGVGQLPMVEFLREIADRVDGWLSAQEHSTAISRWATVLSGRLGLDGATQWRLELAGRLHDIGKIVVPEVILTTPSRLTDEQWALLRQHPDHGARLARMVPGFDAVAESIRQHHERYDGTGYPDRLAGSGIRLEARIIAVCDSWAAMRSDRAYQAALTEEQAREQLWSGRGTQFDPDLVDLFLDLHERGAVGDLHLLPPAPVTRLTALSPGQLAPPPGSPALPPGALALPLGSSVRSLGPPPPGSSALPPGPAVLPPGSMPAPARATWRVIT